MIGRLAFALAGAVLLAPHEPDLGLTSAKAIEVLADSAAGNASVEVADVQAVVFERLRQVKADMENNRRR